MKIRWLVALLPLVLASASAASEPAPSGSAAALEIARATRSEWRLGRLMLDQREGRPPRVWAEILSGGAVVARLRVNPETGGFLAKDERVQPPVTSLDLARLRGEVEHELGRLEVGGWAWPSEHGRAWGVPLRYQGRVVGRLKVDVQQRRLLAVHDHDDDDD